ncbi:MAG: hypothetical protein AAFX99_23105, partial [Myxococcota bacterium]
MNTVHLRAQLALVWAAALVVGGSGVAQAQGVVESDPELGPELDPTIPTQENPILLEFEMRTEASTYENLDLLPLEEDTDQAIVNTDDRHTFAYSSIVASLDYFVEEGLIVSVSLAHNGLWAEDQVGAEGQLIGALNFYELMFTYTPLEVEPVAVSFELGRQQFKIGGVPKDYIMEDVLDALILTVDGRQFGRLRIMAVDFYTANDLPDASFVRYIGGREPVLGLRGDTFTLRTGLVYEQEGDNALVEGLMLKAYAFYADIGGGPIDETGADITYGGSLGNFSDNDWAAVYGARAGYTLGIDAGTELTVFAEGAQSTGIDRKEDVARDV